MQSCFLIDGSLRVPKKIFFHAPTTEGGSDMTTIFEAALAAKKNQTKNISELGVFDPRKLELEEVTRMGSDGKPFTMAVAKVGGEEYRVPYQVLLDIQALAETRPDMVLISVVRSGQGKNDTRYSIVIEK